MFRARLELKRQNRRSSNYLVSSYSRPNKEKPVPPWPPFTLSLHPPSSSSSTTKPNSSLLDGYCALFLEWVAHDFVVVARCCFFFLFIFFYVHVFLHQQLLYFIKFELLDIHRCLLPPIARSLYNTRALIYYILPWDFAPQSRALWERESSANTSFDMANNKLLFVAINLSLSLSLFEQNALNVESYCLEQQQQAILLF